MDYALETLCTEENQACSFWTQSNLWETLVLMGGWQLCPAVVGNRKPQHHAVWVEGSSSVRVTLLIMQRAGLWTAHCREAARVTWHGPLSWEP